MDPILYFERSLQAAAFLVRLDRGPIDPKRLMALLNVADRELLTDGLFPLSGATD